MANQIGEHDAPDPVVESLQFLARSESMDMSNDPRFFRGNLLDKRLAAFGMLGVISGFMVDTATGQTFDMKKDIHLGLEMEAMDLVKFTSFLLFSFVNFANVVAIYVTVAQTYHTIRLMTAGSTGFEQSKLYYLNQNIVFYRHVAIRLMLNSLWVMMIAVGCRMFTKFSEDAQSGPDWAEATPEEPPSSMGGQPHFSGLTALGGFICVFYFFLALVLYWTHVKHVQVFRERYGKMVAWDEPLLSTVATVSTRGRGQPLDV